MPEFVLLKFSSSMLLETFLSMLSDEIKSASLVERLRDTVLLIIGEELTIPIATAYGVTLKKHYSGWEFIHIDSVEFISRFISEVASQNFPLIEVYSGKNINFASDLKTMDRLIDQGFR